MNGTPESDLSEYLSGLAMARAQLCRLAALLLTYPDAALARAFAEGPLWEQCIGIARVMDAGADATGADAIALAGRAPRPAPLAAALEHSRDFEAAPDPERWFHALRVEYTRLFCQTPLVVSPFGAHYFDGTTDEEHAVRHHYATAGIVLRPDFHERADHIAAEWDFLFYLAHAEALAWGQGDQDEAREWQEMQRAFFGRHLKPFAPAFAEALACAAASPVYVFAARLVDALAHDAFLE